MPTYYKRDVNPTNNNWNQADNWSTVSSTSSVNTGTFPSSTTLDPVIFDANSTGVIINVASTCTSLDCTGFVGTIDFSNTLTIPGNITLGAGMTTTGTGLINKTGTGTMTSNGHILSTGINHTAGNLTWVDNWDILSYTTGFNNITWTGLVTVKVRTNFTVLNYVNTTLGSETTLELTGTGNFRISTGGNPSTSSLGIRININTLGTITFVVVLICNTTFTYTQGNVVTTGVTLSLGGGVTLDTDRTGTGGGKISFSSITRAAAGTGNIVLLSDLTTLGNMSNTIGTSPLAGIGRTIYVGGNLGASWGSPTFCEPVIIMDGPNNASIIAGQHFSSIVIAKTGGAVVTTNGSYALASTNRTFQVLSGVLQPTSTTWNYAAGGGTPTFDNWITNNLTLNTTTTITINNSLTITDTLTIQANTIFAGTHGFTTNNLTCTTAASTITLQNINANPLAEYRITGLLTLIGTLASRITLQAAGFATFTGTINPVGQLNIATGTAPSIGMTISQAANTSPAGLIGLLPNRPVITGGSNPTFTISPSATQTLGSTSMRAGFKAKFILENNGVATQNVAYVTTQDIDSSDGQTILAFGSNNDDVSSNVSLYRTLNWGPLIAPNGSAAYTFVN